MKKILLILLAATLLSSCKNESQGTLRTTNSEFKVDFLFEVDGIRVYRFIDCGRYIYFTDKEGDTRYSHQKVVGKTILEEPVQCLNN